MNSNRKLFLYLILGIGLFRLIYIQLVPLVPQEAYYWKYAKHLAWSYFDHPPMTAYVIALFTYLGGDSPFFIRLGSILFSTGLMVLLFRITENMFHDSLWALLSVVIASCTVLFSIGSSIMTPDVPLLFFWTWIIYCLIRLSEARQSRWWYFAGIGLGFALLSKYTAILIVPGIFMYLLVSPQQRRWLYTIHPYLGLFLALIVFSPVLYWNYQHEWVSFLFQSSSRFSGMKRFRLDYFFQLLGSQMGLLTPYMFFLCIIGWVRIGWLSIRERNDRYALLFWIALPVYAVFTLSSFRSLVKMNWLAPAYITSIIAGVVWLHSSSSKGAIRFRKWLKHGLILGLIIVLLFHLLPVIPLFPIRRGDTWTGWHELASRVMQLKAEMGEKTFIFGHEYKIPSEITFYTSPHQPTHSGEIIGEPGLQYTFWTHIDSLLGHDAIFVTSNAERYRNIGQLEKCFERVEALDLLIISHHQRIFRIFYLYRCHHYKGPVS